MPKKVKLKIFGERNTGTNYLSELINSNLDVHLLKGSLNKNSLFTFREWSKDLYFYITSFYNFGWKHSKIDSKIAEKIKENFYIILLSKYVIFLDLENKFIPWN